MVDGDWAGGVIGGGEVTVWLCVEETGALIGVALAFVGLIDFARSARLAARSWRPRSISSSNFLMRSASTLSRSSDSALIDCRNSAGSKSLSSAARCEADVEASEEAIVPNFRQSRVGRVNAR